MKPLVNNVFIRRISTSLSPYFNQVIVSEFSRPNFFETDNAGLFGINELQDSDDFVAFANAAKAQTANLICEAFHSNRQRKMVEVFDEMSNCLCKVADLAEFIRVGHPDPKFRLSATEASMAISRDVEKLNVHRDLYNQLKKVVDEGDKFETTEMDKEVARLFLHDFEQSGVHLNDAERDAVVKLNDYILHVGGYFVSRSSEPTIVPKSEVPDRYRHKFPVDGNHLVVRGLFTHSDDEELRELAFRLFYKEDEHREKLLRQMLLARHTLARLCGFASFADRAIGGGIFNSPNQVDTFLNRISDRLKPLAQQDYNILFKLKKNLNPAATELRAWDPTYLTEYFKTSKLSSTIQKCTAYFSLGACMDGLNHIFNSLFNINLSYCESKRGELWHPDVIKLNVLDLNNNELGSIYCDFFERDDKAHQDCHFTIQGGCKLSDGTYQNPIVVLVLSLPRPSKHTPSLLPPHMVDNLFHEMGHAIHSILARTPYQHITGTRCSTDLAEVPSILMEYFIQDPRVVSTFAKHYATGESIPNDLLESWVVCKKFFNASETQLQLFYAALDQAYHGVDPLLGANSTNEQAIKVCKEHFSLGCVPGVAWQLRFGHLVGYGAKYYSYLVSRSLARLIWTKHFSNNPFSKEAGNIYQSKVLSHGGGKPPSQIIEDILERSVDPEYLADSLIDDIVDCNQRCGKFL